MTAAALTPLADPAEFPNCVRLLASARYQAALRLPDDPAGPIDDAAAAAIELSCDLVRLTVGLGWEPQVRQVMVGFPPVER